MAYLRDLPRCITCHGTAKVEVIGQFNNSLGFFCTSHGRARLRRQEEIEQKNWATIKTAETPERAAELRKMLA
jgi:hypothetical protein